MACDKERSIAVLPVEMQRLTVYFDRENQQGGNRGDIRA